ncbi:MAG: cyclic nucleotide-binding domain-containing protein [Nitrospinae bacterium]|nr:cyclic nucleotide-binding domain-containing protein [Nitrospinota bacterium]
MIKNVPIIGRFKDGDVIVTEGIISNNAYIVLSGEVRVLKKIDDKQVIIGRLKKGDVFGEMGLISNTHRSASVIAVGEVNIGIIDKESFIIMLNDIPNDLRCIIDALVERLKVTTKKLANIGIQLEKAKKTINAFSLQTIEREE